MSITPFTSTSGGLTNVTSFPDIPPDSAAMRAQFQTPSDELATYINSTLLVQMTDVSGWTSANETWAYASANTITVPTGAASRYQKGDRIKWTQTTVKYGVIIAVADTLLTIAINTDFVVTNAVISANCYSHQENSMGFPTWFNYTPTGPTNTTMSGRFCIIGKLLKCYIVGSLTGTPSFASMPTLPVAASASYYISNSLVQGASGIGGYYDASGGFFANGLAPEIVASGTVCNLCQIGINNYAFSATVPITWVSSDAWYATVEYKI
jgi:hypothetical protein